MDHQALQSPKFTNRCISEFRRRLQYVTRRNGENIFLLILSFLAYIFYLSQFAHVHADVFYPISCTLILDRYFMFKNVLGTSMVLLYKQILLLVQLKFVAYD